MKSLLQSAAILIFVAALNAATPPKCDTDNGGITLPSGLCALVVADNLGQARHLAVAENGDVYVAIRGNNPGGVFALRDTNGDGRFEMKEHFGEGSATGVALRHGYLYVAHPTKIERYKMTAGQLVPSGAPETIVAGLPAERQHEDKGLAFDDKGSLYINVGAPSNACQNPDRKPKVKGQDPCPVLEKARRCLEVR